MSEKVISRCPYCDFRVTQRMAETLAESRVVSHMHKSHKEEFSELIRKALEKAEG